MPQGTQGMFFWENRLSLDFLKSVDFQESVESLGASFPSTPKIPMIIFLSQALLDIIQQIVHILDAYREADEGGVDACCAQLLITQLTMGVAGGM